jgi:hypothetical protein
MICHTFLYELLSRVLLWHNWCFFLPAKLAKRSTKKDILGGLRPLLAS